MSCLTNLITFYDWITGLASEERVDFNKIFKTFFSKMLPKKLMKFSLDGQTVSWIENWLNSQAQRVVMSVLKSLLEAKNLQFTSGINSDSNYG